MTNSTNRLRFIISCALLLVAAMTATQAESRSPENQVFQFMATQSLSYTNGKQRAATGYLWISPACQRVRGVLVAGQNVPEHWLVGHPAIRQACADSGLAILWCCPTFFDWKIDDGNHQAKFVQRLLDVLAAQSGYDELATVPWLLIGESMHLQMVTQIIKARPDRCIAGVQVKNAILSPPDTGVPMLLAVGTTCEWDQEKVDMLNQWKNLWLFDALRMKRIATPTWPCSLLIEGGSGHFECTEPMAQYIAQYIRAAASARLSPDGSPVLRPVNLDDGCLAVLPVPGVKRLPLIRYKDSPPELRCMPWYFNEALAKAAYSMADINWNAATQVPAFADATGKPIPFGHRGIFSPVPFTTEADGMTFQLHTGFVDKIPDGWVHGGTPLSHAPGNPSIEWICGPVAPLGGNRFRIALNRAWQNMPTFIRVWHSGNETYRHSVQPGELKITPNTNGTPQTITFPPIPDQPVGVKEIQLHATSDAGLPVQFFVRAGPAEIHGDRLVFTPLPPRTKLPVTVTVVAWQWGRTANPAIQTAAVVERSFQIHAAPAGGNTVSLWTHIRQASDLGELRAMTARWGADTYGNVLKLTSSKVENYAWAVLPAPKEGWSLVRRSAVECEIVNRSAQSLNVLLWVVGDHGWDAVADVATLSPGTTRRISCRLRETFPDGTPKIDPGQVKQIQIMISGRLTTPATLEVRNLVATGDAPEWKRPVGRLDVPGVEDAAPTPGHRVRFRLAGDERTGIYSVLHLPDDWKPGGKYPVIVEFPGNIFFTSACYSTGLPDQCTMGFGVSRGKGAICIGLPFVDRQTGAIAENGWSNPDDTAGYAMKMVEEVCAKFGGDRANVVLTGFSRGAIACGYIGLRNERIAALWKGFHACQHYDGDGWNGATMEGAIERARRFRGKSVFQTDNSRDKFQPVMDAMKTQVAYVNSGLGAHATAMFLDDRPSTQQLRNWFRDLVGNRK